VFAIGVIAPSQCSSITMLGLFDVIGRADRAYGVLKGRPGTATIYDVKLIGLDGAPVEYRDRVSVRPDLAAAEVASMDVVVVPGLDDDLDASFELNKAWAPWLAKWHAEGATIAASCSGTFLLAEAGLLDGRAATTHWLYADKLATRYPRVKVATQRLLIDHGDVITSGGATTFLDLAIYVVERFGGAERANAAARMLLIDRDRQSQLPYAVSAGHDRFHSNELVHRAQDHIDDRLGTDLRVRDIAAAVGVSERTLVRHFRAELGASVQAQIRRQRIEAAKRFLETSDSPVDSIRRYVGYRDATSFRRAFREETGLTPQGFRGKFAWH
jgi:transcriptional regulator GlxA family with amidase domain